jgi:hypothetical protein
MFPPEDRGNTTIVKGCAMRGGGGSPIDARPTTSVIAKSRSWSPVDPNSLSCATSPDDPIRKLIASR